MKVYWAHLGTVEYADGLLLQRNLRARSLAQGSSFLLLLEHTPTVTLGYRTTQRSACLLSTDELRRLGIGVVATERGGAATYHGPGQLVVYPLFFLPAWGLGVREFVWRLEEVGIRVASQSGVRAGRKDAYRGVWVGDKKLGAIGVAIKKRISFHGLSINVNVDLGPFSYIVPCGLRDKGITSLKGETGREIDMGGVVTCALRAFSEVFEADLEQAPAIVDEARRRPEGEVHERPVGGGDPPGSPACQGSGA